MTTKNKCTICREPSQRSECGHCGALKAKILRILDGHETRGGHVIYTGDRVKDARLRCAYELLDAIDPCRTLDRRVCSMARAATNLETIKTLSPDDGPAWADLADYLATTTSIVCDRIRDLEASASKRARKKASHADTV